LVIVKPVVANPSSVWRSIGRLALLLALCGCAGADDGDFGGSGAIINPWAAGGQTGALLPPCGLTPAARAGDSIPGGNAGIVIHTDQCGVGFAAAELELHDEDGLMVAFDLVPLTGDAILIKPRSPLTPGVYTLTIAGTRMESVVADEPEALPTELGSLRPLGSGCDAAVELEVDPKLLEYLPQLKLSVSVDGEPEQPWFDYGTLDVQGGRATLVLPHCSTGQCLENGTHTLRVTGEIAGEGSTLMPVDADVEVSCAQPASASDDGACSAVPGRGAPGTVGGAAFGLLAAALLWLRRARRSSA
jgi:MYXO-CTERM domain-containing protein